jgi:tetratricopeptide (TPR) repeat protein
MRGWALEEQGRPDQALAAYQYALRLWQVRHGDNYGMSGWAHMLVGKAYAAMGDTTNANVQMQIGLPILRQVFGEHSSRYLLAELAYSRLLDQNGSHTQAKELRDAAQQEFDALRVAQCATCSISVAALR